ncbi:hypothetical protein EYF80_051084 [Liparis tanakae]|uniref:Uncharacterized protein n=1 Tax=Liparis tanakae TaxID=230148 RepID=A0A4Z2FEB5_9TELE|nr:hypothetical protein EYF80_051084 [Liparis tanakae]
MSSSSFSLTGFSGSSSSFSCRLRMDGGRSSPKITWWMRKTEGEGGGGGGWKVEMKAPHPHVGQEHLTAGVSDEVSVFGRHRQLQAGGVAPVLQLVRQQLHGHLLVLLIGLVEQFHCQLGELSGK